MNNVYMIYICHIITSHYMISHHKCYVINIQGLTILEAIILRFDCILKGVILRFDCIL